MRSLNLGGAWQWVKRKVCGLLKWLRFVMVLLGVEGKTTTLNRKVLDQTLDTCATHATYDKAAKSWGQNEKHRSDPCTDHWYGIICVEEDSVQYVSEIDLSVHELPVRRGLPDT